MSRFAPTYLIKLDGEQLSQDLTNEISSFLFEDNEEKQDYCEIVLNNRYLKFSDNPLFQEGNELEVRFGYIGNLSEIKTFKIEEPEHSIVSVGMPTITLKGYEKSTPAQTRTGKKVWEDVTPSEVAEEIAGKYSWGTDVEDTKTRKKITQSNESETALLKRLAESEGFVFYLENDVLHFHKSRLDQKPYKTFKFVLKGEKKVISFKPDIEKKSDPEAGATDNIEIAGIDDETGETFRGKVDEKDVSRIVLADGKVAFDPETGQFSEQVPQQAHEASASIPDVAVDNSIEAEERAKNKIIKKEQDLVKAELVALGEPDIKSKKVIRILGVSRKWSGNWYIVKATHKIDGGGYLATMDLKRTGVNKDVSPKAGDPGGTLNEQTPPPESEATEIGPEETTTLSFNPDTGEFSG